MTMDLKSLALAAVIVAFGAAQYTLVVQAIRDLIRRPRVRGGNKMSWAILILCVPILGAFFYSWMGPTSFLRRGASLPPRRLTDPVTERASQAAELRPENVTPIHGRRTPTPARAPTPARTAARRAGLTRSRAHSPSGPNRVRRTGS
jgi:hypothetical protein